MQFEIVTLEVDGSLSNPIVLRTVLIWGLFLSAVTVLAVRWWERGGPRREHGRAKAAIFAVALGILYLATPVAQFVLGNVLYQLDFTDPGRRLASVGFWGGPPVLPALAMAGLSGAVAAFALRRLVSSRRHREA